MNRRVCVWIGSVLGCALTWRAAGFGTGSLAGAQVPPLSAAATPPAPTPAVTAAAATAAITPLVPLQIATVTPGQQVGTIAPFIAKQLAALAAPDVGGSASIARQALMLGCPRLGNAPGTCTPSFAGAYSTELSLAAAKLLSAPATSAAVKINVGIVVERVANNAQSTMLLPAVQKLLADRGDPVVYWGCKAARPMVMALVLQPGFGGKTPLFRNIVDAVSQHSAGPMAGLIATEAYRALVVNPNNVPGMPAAQVKPLLKPLYDPVLDLLALRTSKYADGIIPAPDAEANVPTFLTTTTPPPIYSAAQKSRAVQELVDLIDMAGQRAAAANPAQVIQLRSTVQNAASALNVFSGTSLLSKVSLMPMGVNGQGIAALCSTVFPSMDTVFSVPKLKKPATLAPLAPTTAPAGGPTVGAG